MPRSGVKRGEPRPAVELAPEGLGSGAVCHLLAGTGVPCDDAPSLVGHVGPREAHRSTRPTRPFYRISMRHHLCTCFHCLSLSFSVSLSLSIYLSLCASVFQYVSVHLWVNHACRERQTDRNRERERQIDRQTDRERETDKETERQSETESKHLHSYLAYVVV